MHAATAEEQKEESLATRLRTAGWVRDAAALSILALAVLLFFWPVILGRAWIPRGGGDAVSFIYPMYRFAAQSLHAGTVPLWNPYQYAGAPFIADNQTGIFYPFNLLLFLLRPNFSYRAVEALVIWHFFFAGAATYVCLRRLQPHAPLARPAAVLGGLAFMFSGVFITHIGNPNLIAVAAWLPLLFLALHRAIVATKRRPRLAWVVAGGVATGVSTLAGHGQMTFLLAAFLGAYALYRTAVDRSLRPLLLLLLLGAVAVAIAAVSLFPALEAVPYTVRAAFDEARAANYALPPRGLTGLLAPDFFGRNEVNFWGGWPRVEYGYVGLLTLFLAATAVFQKRTPLTLFFALGGLLFLLLALGPYTPLYSLLLRLLPAFPFQAPARFLLLLNFCLAALAAFGMDGLLRRPGPSRRFLAGAAVATLLLGALLAWQYGRFAPAVPHHQQQMVRALLVFAALAGGSWLLLLARARGRLTPALFAALAIAWLAVDLIGLGRYVEIEWNDPTPGFAAGSPALAFLRADPGIHRIDIATGAWQPNLPQMAGLYSIRGVYNPLELSNYAAYIGSVGYRGSPQYNLLGVKYIIGGKKTPPGDTNFIIPVFADDPDVTVYLNTRALPRVAVLYNAAVVADHDAAFAATHADDFDPRNELILEEGRPLQQEPGQATITVLRYDANAAAFEVTADKPGYFLLSDIYHPHWQAWVNGAPTPILVADYAFRAVPVTPGTQQIEMRFAPPGWRWGLATSLLAWAAVAAFALWLWRGRKVDAAR